MKILRWIQHNTITSSVILLLTLVAGNTGCLLYNNDMLERNTALKVQTERIRRINTDIWNEIVRNMDIGMRGYAITQDTTLLSPYRSSIAKKDQVFQELAHLLEAQHYPITGLDFLKSEVNAYQQVCAALVKLVDEGNLGAVSQEVKKDRGKQLWKAYADFTTRLNADQDALNQQAEVAYQTATQRTVYLQILLLLIGAPSLLFIIGRIKRDRKEKRNLFLNLERNNRTYLFDPGTAEEATNEQQLIDTSIANFRKAAGFIQQLSQGDYQVEWEGLSAANQLHNQTNLAGELVRMRERLKQLKQADERRLWATEGLTQFSEIIRQHQNHGQHLSNQIVAFLTKYLQAQQGSLFLLREEEEPCLELAACYAFERKKHLTKRVAIGQGLVGQTYLERSPILLTELPPGYISITSGLGDATPGCLVLVPMKYNEKVEAIIEIASFHRLEAYQVEWLEKVGEITASTLVSVKTVERTKTLLEASQQQAEEMKSQEEEMRQNMEELEATQEEMQRKERSHLDQIEQLTRLHKTNKVEV
ncbi:MAG: CHASE3 domain-containing protein [Ferruginibacter sp.]|nr:CHASE3 domain-containing protein [Cytophagales bacterium]